MPVSRIIPGVSETTLARLAEDVAFAARPSDLITLSGQLGAGKTTFARAFIRTLANGGQEEIPSPTFTLVQTYATARMPVAHFDLYRLSMPSELEELGLEHALQGGLALVEWPERAGGILPHSRLEITLEDDDHGATRRVTLVGHGDWEARLVRFIAMRDLMAGAKVSDASCALHYLQGDASVRRYARLSCRDRSLLLMDWARQPDGPAIRNGLPYSRIAHLAEDVRPFVAVSTALHAAGLSTPQIYAQDLDQGFLLLEDLGDRVFAREVETGAASQEELWRVGVDALIALRAARAPDTVPVYDHGALGIEVELLTDWFWPALHGEPTPQEARDTFLTLWGQVFDRLAEQPKGWVLRDYHSPNLLWLPQRAGIARVGVIDFQDAMCGAPAYDLVSLLQDARVDVPAELEARLFDHYCAAVERSETGFSRDDFAFAYAALGAQRNTKILGIFARLAQRDGKPQYLRHIPRLWRYLERDLQHAQLGALKDWYDRHMPRAARGGLHPETGARP
jgi:tRNA threonylcarbamoyl adenosine modification protein YjeE